MKKQTANTTTTTTPKDKNFCAAINADLSAKLDSIAAENKIKNKPALMAFLVANTVENAQLKEQISVLRYENIPYKIECFIVGALKKDAPINKQAVQNYIGKKVNLGTIDAVLCHYLDEIKQHAEKYQYGTDKKGNVMPRWATFIAGLDAAKKAL